MSSVTTVSDTRGDEIHPRLDFRLTCWEEALYLIFVCMGRKSDRPKAVTTVA